jgi:hypothetical protein
LLRRLRFLRGFGVLVHAGLRVILHVLLQGLPRFLLMLRVFLVRLVLARFELLALFHRVEFFFANHPHGREHRIHGRCRLKLDEPVDRGLRLRNVRLRHGVSEIFFELADILNKEHARQHRNHKDTSLLSTPKLDEGKREISCRQSVNYPRCVNGGEAGSAARFWFWF